MARTLSSPLHVARHFLQSSEAWLLFVRIPLASGAEFRLVRNGRHLVADGKVWQACSVEIEIPEEDADGSLGELSIAVPNVSRVPLAYVEHDGELLGRTVTVWLQHEGSLGAFEPSLSWQHLVVSVEADEGRLRIVCGHPAQAQRGPSRQFTRAEFPQLLPTGAS